jgi:hypothetical protein
VINLETSKTPAHEYLIFVNKKQLKVTEASLTGQQILTIAGYDINQYDLFLVHGQQSEQIQSNQSVEIKNGMHFNAILKSAPYG